MAEACREVYEYIQSSFGNDMTFLVIYAVCLVYLSFCGKKRRCQLVYPSLLITFVLVCPPFYKYVWTRLMDYGYWRSFWMIPVVPVYAVTAAEIINKPFSQWGRGLFLAAIAGVLIVVGNNIYTVQTLHSTFEEVDNKYKLPDEIVAIAEALLELDDEPKVLMAPAKYYNYIRQYSSDINTLATNLAYYEEKSLLKLDNPMGICFSADLYGCRYIVLPEYVSGMDFEKYGYALSETIMGNAIYVNQYTQNRWDININKGSESFLSISDSYGRYGLIDGGSSENEESLRKYIYENGGSIHAWLVSSLENKMSGGCFSILNEKKGIYIYSIQSGNIVDVTTMNLSSDCNLKLEYLKKYGQMVSQCKFLGLEMEILNDYSEVLSEKSNYVIDDSSMIIKFCGKVDTFLYVSNVTQNQLDKIVEQYKEELKSDYLVINNLNCTDYSSLEKEVSPLKIYNLQALEDSESFTIR